MRTVPIYGIDGKKKGEIAIPVIFSEPVREEIIRRAFIAEQTLLYQPKGTMPMAGMRTTAEYIGRKESYRAIKNRGISRLPREKLPKGRFGRVRMVPHSVGGRRAHPPKPEKKLIELINRKEYMKALRSAIAATAVKEWITARGYSHDLEVPIVLDNKFEEMKKTKEVAETLRLLGLDGEIKRGSIVKARSGVRKRKGGTKRPKTVLIVVSEDKGILKAARNIAGADASLVKELTVSTLAPGGVPGRITIWSEGAIRYLSEAYGS
ncbi:MAG: 50S ribosomal protein L4 [Candidatus Micrarchaeia archaeon]